MNQLNIAGDEAETVISSSGEGWSLRVLIGFSVGLLLTFCGAIITLGIVSAAVVGLSNGEWRMARFTHAVSRCRGSRLHGWDIRPALFPSRVEYDYHYDHQRPSGNTLRWKAASEVVSNSAGGDKVFDSTDRIRTSKADNEAGVLEERCSDYT